MSLGLPEVTLILVIILALFGIAWIAKINKRLPRKSGNGKLPTEDKKNDRQV